MVFYELLMTTKDVIPYKALTELTKSIAHKVVENGGIVRGVQNHGIRVLPNRFRARYPDETTGSRYFQKGRFISLYYDSSPKVMSEVGSLVKMHDDVLRETHLKVRNKMWYVNIVNEKKNPYIQRVKAMEEAGTSK
mmetsp:Transcript_22939/g.35310  ORF Transcript_22939/g.35310 Transcript_22939/m.35310 type:complete len:136 (+) Transcript_22939:113-520(+)|eukprot:CAMPEP_0196805958 /NCGR_PEP_ID=MMETSP1362-20130617/5819_1 /TAXON_ID=163516 /ORGANISM="Leptocylindrus danicus, Strain CCMP1856" /LENGTH=135 /DNA_ID=CAMNT_0042179195 /DNA_START=61 /DNA_END=468 /DNA_ORIENTATION=-